MYLLIFNMQKGNTHCKAKIGNIFIYCVMQWILHGTRLQIFSQSHHFEVTKAASPQAAAEFCQWMCGIGCQWCCQMQPLSSADAKIWHRLSKLTRPRCYMHACKVQYLRMQWVDLLCPVTVVSVHVWRWSHCQLHEVHLITQSLFTLTLLATHHLHHRCGSHYDSHMWTIGSRPSDHYFVVSVGSSVCLCRVFLSRLWSNFDQTRTYVICLGLVVSPRTWSEVSRV